MKPRVYLETTVVSYLAARPSRDLITAAHQKITRQWWEQRRKGFDLFISQLVLDEARGGDSVAARRRLELVGDLPLLELTSSVTELAQIAFATVHQIDYLLTWNLTHIANAFLRRAVTIICQDAGYLAPTICTPEELFELQQ